MANILITGGTGLVGKRLTDFLLKKKHNVRILSRNPSAENEYKWDVGQQLLKHWLNSQLNKKRQMKGTK